MKELPEYMRLTVAALGISLIIVAMILGRLLFVPLAWAILLSLMVMPFAAWLERKVKRRTLASILTVFAFVVVVAGIIFLLTYQSVGLAGDAPQIAEKIATTVEDLRRFADERLGFAYEEQPELVKSEVGSAASGMISSVGNTVSQTLTTLGTMLVLPIYMFFLLRYRDHFFEFMIRLTVAKNQVHTTETLTKASTIVQKYLRGAGIEIVIVAVMVCILFLILGIKHALFFAVLVSLLNVIPYLGVLVGSLISVLYAYLTTDTMVTPVLVFVFLWVIQIIDNNFIVPLVVGQQIKLNPLAVILVVILGGLIWGISGMVLFVPFLGILKVILDESKTMKHYGFLLGDDEPAKKKRGAAE